ncbi:hypothetical protein A0H81_11618 [Grifola frondosa]|uniref:Uncharacterized protein n=1 Tax=Grifola frondosa TaxID=5627 RepID=A0A1C7M073_GRIFR|nr:hypothetical protein A0H81_11618 [Grifola frondosa]
MSPRSSTNELLPKVEPLLTEGDSYDNRWKDAVVSSVISIRKIAGPRSEFYRQIYGGIGVAIGATALITVLALSNHASARSYLWTRVSKTIWPFIIVIAAVRAIIMIVELQRGKDKIQWECDNGGLWTASAEAGYGGTSSFPSGFCTAGFSSLNVAFIISLLVDLAFQMYMFFLIWRFQKRLEHYQNMKGPFYGGYYNA